MSNLVALNKKSQIFTLIAIALLFLLFVSYEIYSTVYERIAIKTRVKTMDSFLSSLENYLGRQFYISGFRILFLAEDKITRTGTYISNFDSFFDEAIMQGKVDGVTSDILIGVTLTDIENSIKEKADKMNLLVSLSNTNIRMTQEDPWHVAVIFNATLNLTDKSNLASWYKNETIIALIEVEGFEDPVYLINSNGKVSRKINQTIYDGEYVSGADVDNLLSHLENRYYTNNTLAPSFLKRMKGDLTADANGIESFVYLPEMSAQGMQVKEKSVVDYIYFSLSNPGSTTISGMPPWFRIDSEHCSRYQLSC